MTTSQKKEWMGHLVRWCIILFTIGMLIRISSAPIPWSLESFAKQRTDSMQVPQADIVSAIQDNQGMTSVVLMDKDNRMYHHFLAKKKYGLFWTDGGGGYGMKLDVDTLLHFRLSMSTIGNYRCYTYTDIVSDLNIASLRITWQDGAEEEVAIQEGIAHAVHSISIMDEKKGKASQTAQLVAYDAHGNILYELSEDYEHSRVPKPEA